MIGNPEADFWFARSTGVSAIAAHKPTKGGNLCNASRASLSAGDCASQSTPSGRPNGMQSRKR